MLLTGRRDLHKYFSTIKNVFSGNFDIYIDSDNGPQKVGSYDGTGFFGELALMYNMPRAATIRAVTNGVLWSLVSQKKKSLIFSFYMKKCSGSKNIPTNHR